MSLIALLVILIVFGVFLWWLNSLPIDPKIRWLITTVVVVVLVLLVLQQFGIWEAVKGVKVPHI